MRLSPAGLLIAALLVTSCQGRLPAGAPSALPPINPTLLPDSLARQPLPRTVTALRLPGVVPPTPAGSPPKAGLAAPPAVAGAAPAVPPAGSATPPKGGMATRPNSDAGGPGPGMVPVPPPGQTSPGAASAQKGLASAGLLMAIGRSALIMPEDFKIGPLGDERSGPADQAKAVETAGKFLSGLVAGSVDKNLLAADTGDAVAEALSFGLEKGNTPTGFRVGKPRTRDDGEVTAAVRLFGHESSSEGEIYVAKSGSQWLVSDLQLNLGQLAVKSEKPKEKFFPLDYRWLLEE